MVCLSMSEAVRDELAAIAPARECCALAEIAGIAMTAGRSPGEGDQHEPLVLDVSAAVIARRAFSLFRLFDASVMVTPYQQPAFGREMRYAVAVASTQHELQVLEEAGILGAGLLRRAVPPRRVVRRGCCRASLLRGAMLGGCSVSGPRDPHLELRVSDGERAEFILSTAAASGVVLAQLDRERHLALYAKGVEAVSDLLALTGAQDAALDFREATVVLATRARANRLANSDHANLVRSSRSSAGELRAIRRLESAGALEDLSPELTEIARLRLANPSLSVRELGECCDPPLGKATTHRRLKRLERLGRSHHGRSAS